MAERIAPRAWLAAAMAIPLVVTPALLALPDTGLAAIIAGGAAALVMGGAVAWIEASRPSLPRRRESKLAPPPTLDGGGRARIDELVKNNEPPSPSCKEFRFTRVAALARKSSLD